MRRELVQDGPHGLHEGLVAAGLHGLPLGHLGRPGRLADLDGPTPLRLTSAPPAWAHAPQRPSQASAPPAWLKRRHALWASSNALLPAPAAFGGLTSRPRRCLMRICFLPCACSRSPLGAILLALQGLSGFASPAQPVRCLLLVGLTTELTITSSCACMLQRGPTPLQGAAATACLGVSWLSASKMRLTRSRRLMAYVGPESGTSRPGALNLARVT